jgi:hypothetical protein
VFLLGGIATAAAIPAVWALLPESLDFLLVRRPARALERVNALAARMGQPALDRLPEQTEAPAGVGATFRELLTPRLRRATLVLWVAFFCVMAGFYFVTSWTPTLLVEAGLSPAQGITAGTLLNLGGVFGAALLGLLAARFALRNVLISYLIATAVLLAVFIASTSTLALAFAVGIVVGLFVNGCVAGLLRAHPDGVRPGRAHHRRRHGPRDRARRRDPRPDAGRHPARRRLDATAALHRRRRDLRLHRRRPHPPARIGPRGRARPVRELNGPSAREEFP